MKLVLMAWLWHWPEWSWRLLAGGKVVAVVTYMVCDVAVVTPMVFWGLAVGVLNPKESKNGLG